MAPASLVKMGGWLKRRDSSARQLCANPTLMSHRRIHIRFICFSGRGACWEVGRGVIKHSLDDHGLGEPGRSGAGGEG